MFMFVHVRVPSFHNYKLVHVHVHHVQVYEYKIAFCRAEKEYSALSKQLTRELDEKSKIIHNLAKQLEAHQKDFNELKAELSKVSTCTCINFIGQNLASFVGLPLISECFVFFSGKAEADAAGRLVLVVRQRAAASERELHRG